MSLNRASIDCGAGVVSENSKLVSFLTDKQGLKLISSDIIIGECWCKSLDSKFGMPLFILESLPNIIILLHVQVYAS